MKLKHALVCFFLLCPFVSHAAVDQTIPQFIATTAKLYGVDVQQALYVSWMESHWNPEAMGDYSSTTQKFTSFGIWQIHNPESKKIRPLTIQQAKDIYISTYWAMQTMLEDGSCAQWSTCPTPSG